MAFEAALAIREMHSHGVPISVPGTISLIAIDETPDEVLSPLEMLTPKIARVLYGIDAVASEAVGKVLRLLQDPQDRDARTSKDIPSDQVRDEEESIGPPLRDDR